MGITEDAREFFKSFPNVEPNFQFKQTPQYFYLKFTFH